MKQLLKYFLVGTGIFAAVIAAVMAFAGIVMGIGYMVDHHPLTFKIIAGTLASIMAIAFLTAYGWLICDS